MKKAIVYKRPVYEQYAECPHCGEEISDFEFFLADCMPCPYCGGEIEFESE